MWSPCAREITATTNERANNLSLSFSTARSSALLLTVILSHSRCLSRRVVYFLLTVPLFDFDLFSDGTGINLREYLSHALLTCAYTWKWSHCVINEPASRYIRVLPMDNHKGNFR